MSNIANLLTLSRIAAIPLIVILLLLPGGLARWLALGLYALACLTDFFDGYIARRFGLASALGRFLDPIADKLVVAAILLALASNGEIAGWLILPALVILCREILVSGLREYLAELRVGMPVSLLAKWKTAAQMTALGFLILGAHGPRDLPVAMIGAVLLWAAAILTVITGYDYLRLGLRHMEGRK